MKSNKQSQTVRLHIQQNPADPFNVDEIRFRQALSVQSRLKSRFDLSFGSTTQDFERHIPSAEILFVGGLDRGDLLRQASKLRWIQSTSAGVESLTAWIPGEVILTNASGLHAEKGAEYAIGAIIMLNSSIGEFIENQHAARWQPIFTPSLRGKSVVIVGPGAIGLAVAQQAKHFQMRTLAIARSPQPRPFIDECFSQAQLHEVLPKTDFLVITAPATVETRGMIGKPQLDLLPPRAGIVNIGRGNILDEDALRDKLTRGELRGAFLDVFAHEPLPPTSPLWRTPRLIISPHCAIDDPEVYVDRCLEIFFRNAERFLDGSALDNVVDLERGY